MEAGKHIDPAKQDAPEQITSLIKFASEEMEIFDCVKESNDTFNEQSQALGSPSPAIEKETAEAPNHHRVHSISISMPNSPREVKTPKKVLFDLDQPKFSNKVSDSSSALPPSRPKPPKSKSQPIPKGTNVEDIVNGNPHFAAQHPSIARLRDDRFDNFKTFSGRLERQLTNLRGGGRPREPAPENEARQKQDMQSLSVDRYFDALTGPELDQVRPSEEIVLPQDKTWPFLLRFPISSFGICLGVSSQAILWKSLAESKSTSYIHVSPLVNLILWCISVALIFTIAVIYLLKITLYFEAVRREYYHPIRVNFFFAPWIALLFLVIGLPPLVAEKLPHAVWYVLMTPIFCFELKLYGQWMSGGQRRLSKVANPSNHLSVVGNFVGALLGASMGLKEGPIFFFAVGLAHYTVLFVTLYQRLPTNETLPKELHPVFFLFVAAPSVASMAWAKIQGSFDTGSRIAYFIAMFLYFSLAVRINFFRGFKFSLAWWAYTFPMTGAAIATIRYSNEVTNVVTKSLSVILAVISTLVVLSLLVTTMLHAFVLRDLFLNDVAIAITDRKPKHSNHGHRRWFPLRHGSGEEIEHYLKFTSSSESDTKDIESCLDSSTNTTTDRSSISSPEPK